MNTSRLLDHEHDLPVLAAHLLGNDGAAVLGNGPLNAIWEGSGNVIALDILRTLQKDPNALEAYLAEIAPARGAHAGFDRSFDALSSVLRKGVAEARARHVAETMALALEAALLLRHGTPEVAAAFCELRLNGGRAFNWRKRRGYRRRLKTWLASISTPMTFP